MSMVSPEKFLSTVVVVVLLFLFSVTSSAKDPQNYYFSGFNLSQQLIGPFGDASINKQALQLTPDTSNEAYSRSNKSGRVMFLEPFKLWEESSSTSSPSQNVSSKNSSADLDIVASFNSTFLINIYKYPNQSVGEGFTFLIAPDLNIPSASFGQWLGLTNATLDGNPSNKIVAIELDTLKQDFDPNNNHMGLNINSVKSSKTVPLSEFGIEIAPDSPKKYSVWVQYNGKEKLMEVYMADEGLPKPGSPILSEKINLKDYVNQYSYMGFSASTGILTQLNCVLRWELSVEALPRKRDLWKMVVGVVGLAVFGIVVLGMVFYLNKRRVVKNPKIRRALKSLPGMPREFRFKDLEKATNNFSEKMKLGQGGFGVVYKGVLPQENTEVAVKKFSRDNKKGINDFLDELTIINRLRHKHLVRLLGWCHKNGLLLLVYDYMPNGSLDNHLFGGPERILSWENRYNIIAGVASALHYLHDQFDQRVIHRDLKASNIMLDSSFNARLGDFGLARALDNGKTSYAEVEGVPGTMGYVAPECFHMGKATTESDVFGFGAVVLEVVCGKHPLNSNKIAEFHFLVDWVWTLYREGRVLDAVDERLGDNYDAGQAERLLLLGLACSHPIAAQRPKSPMIVQVISGSVPPPYTPFIKPAFVWPATTFTIDVESLITDDVASMSSSNGGSQALEWSLRCERRENYVGHSDISLA